MPVVASATLEVTPVLAGAQASLTEQLSGEASKAGEAAGQEGGAALGSGLVKGIAAGSVAVAGAVAGVGAALVGTAAKTAEYGDQIDKASQKLGVSSTFYQEWEAVLQHSGTSMDRMSATFKKLATASQDASDDQVKAFEAIGLSMDQVKSMSTEELFTNVISGLQGMEEGTERTALATELLGKGAMEMGALLNTSAEDTQGMIDRVHELGGVMGEDAVKAAAEYQDQLQDMKTSFAGIKNGLASELLPTMSDFMGKVANFVVNADLSPLTDTLSAAFSALGDFVGSLDIEAIGGVFQDVMANIGDAVGLAWDVLQTLFNGLRDGFTTISGSLEGFEIDWDAVWEGVSTVVQTAAEMISLAFQLVSEGIAWMVEQAQTEGTIFNAIWENVQIALETMVEVVQEVFNLVTALVAGDWSAAWESAKNIATTVWNAIKSMLTNLWNAIKATASAVWNAISSQMKSVWNSIKATATSVWNQVKTAVMTPINNLKSMLSSAWNAIKSTASSAWNAVKSAIIGPIESAKNTVSGIISRIKGMFPLSIGRIFSNLKLPHFSVTGGVFPYGIGGQGSLPSFNVSWYARAMQSPYLFSDATLFGAGEAGDEILYGKEALLSDIREAAGGKGVTNYITVNGAEDPQAWAAKFARQIKLEMRMA